MLTTAVTPAAALPLAHIMEPASTRAATAGAVNDNAHHASGGSEAGRIGEMLAALVPDGNVRTMEALAVVIVRSDWGRISAAAVLPSAGASPSGQVKDKLVAMTERIARRALAGAIEDPTRAATRFHREGDFPEWARGRPPGAQIGPFLFYPG